MTYVAKALDVAAPLLNSVIPSNDAHIQRVVDQVLERYVLDDRQRAYLDHVPVDRLKEYQSRFTEYFTTRKTELLGRIEKEKALSDALSAELKSAAEEFHQTWK